MLRSLIPTRRRFPGTFSRLDRDLETYWDPFDRFLKQEDWDLIPQPMVPCVNIAETDEMFEVTAELPGMEAKDVTVEFQDGALWISGEKKEEVEEKGRMYHRIESTYGKFNRRIDMPSVVKDTEIDAKFENGILKILVPKSEAMKPKLIKVKSN